MKQISKIFFKYTSVLIILIIVLNLSKADSETGTISEEFDSETQHLTLMLAECIQTALERNDREPISRLEVKAAEARLKQALSSYWPQLNLTMAGTRFDEEPNFIFPASRMSFLGMDFDIPEQDIKLMDRDIYMGSLSLVHPLYMGGRRSAMIDMARVGVSVSREELRKTRLQVIHDVERCYYGTILCKQLKNLSQETLDRFRALLNMTEHFYKEGSGSVDKTDYLRIKVIVSACRSFLEEMEANEESALSALAFFLGFSVTDPEIHPADLEIPFVKTETTLDENIQAAFAGNPQWNQLNSAVKAAQSQLENEKGRYLPVFALTGSVNRIESSYDEGITTEKNKNSWNIGLACEMPLFTGFRIYNQIKEAKAVLDKRKREKKLLEKGLTLKVKQAFMQVRKAGDQADATRESLESAVENRELNVRAYNHDLVEMDDVIQAQLLESVIKAQYYRALHDHVIFQSELNTITGKSSVNEKDTKQ